jgi:methylmalonyl-CoA mutase N-terminal domain/subunit
MILARGGGGLSVAFDMPTLMGHDSDAAVSLGEVGHCGVAVDSAADLDVLFDGIALDQVSTSMTISGPAVPVFCMYVVAAERQGIDVSQLDGTLQTDIFKEYIAQKEWLFAPEPHLRLIGDLMEYCAARIPGVQAAQRVRATTSGRPARRPRRSSRTPSRRLRATSSWVVPGLDIDTFAPACPSSSTATWTSSRRSRSSARPADLGRWLRDVVRREDGEGAVAAVPHAARPGCR